MSIDASTISLDHFFALFTATKNCSGSSNQIVTFFAENCHYFVVRFLLDFCIAFYALEI
jgi:hypothetical protein